MSGDTYAALQAAVEYAAYHGGAFDPTLAPLTDLWGINTENAHVPAQAEIDEALTMWAIRTSNCWETIRYS